MTGKKDNRADASELHSTNRQITHPRSQDYWDAEEVRGWQKKDVGLHGTPQQWPIGSAKPT